MPDLAVPAVRAGVPAVHVSAGAWGGGGADCGRGQRQQRGAPHPPEHGPGEDTAPALFPASAGAAVTGPGVPPWRHRNRRRVHLCMRTASQVWARGGSRLSPRLSPQAAEVASQSESVPWSHEDVPSANCPQGRLSPPWPASRPPCLPSGVPRIHTSFSVGWRRWWARCGTWTKVTPILCLVGLASGYYDDKASGLGQDTACAGPELRGGGQSPSLRPSARPPSGQDRSALRSPGLGHLRGRTGPGRQFPHLILCPKSLMAPVWPLLSLLRVNGSQISSVRVTSHIWTHALSLLAVRIA